MEERRGRRKDPNLLVHLESLKLPLTSLKFLRPPSFLFLSVIEHPHWIVFDGGILVAAVVEGPVFDFFALDFDEVFVCAFGFG